MPQPEHRIDIVHAAKFVSALAGLAVVSVALAQDSGIDAAKQLFAQYIALENAYDPAVADLYADEAFIKTRRSMPMGDPQNIVVPAARYKSLLRQGMPTARARGDHNTYSKVTYRQEGEFVRIDAVRLSGPGKKMSPISLLVGPSPAGKWLIYEQLSESRQ
jgi:hypothetical protein